PRSPYRSLFRSARNLAVARLPRSLVVREHDGDRGTPADLQRFLDRFLQLRALIAQVGRIDAAEGRHRLGYGNDFVGRGGPGRGMRSEEHTSELPSREKRVCP